jgi:ribosomal protein S16
MLTIRLQRSGKKNKPEYRVVLADKTAAAQKKFTEILGAYNPHTKNLTIRRQERLTYWMDEQHVPLSATVQNLFVTKDIIKGNKTKAFTIPKKEVVAEEAPAAASAETPTESPVEAPADAPAEAPAPETAPVEAPPEVTSETPAEIPVPETAPVETPVEVTAETPEAAVTEQA